MGTHFFLVGLALTPAVLALLVLTQNSPMDLPHLTHLPDLGSCQWLTALLLSADDLSFHQSPSQVAHHTPGGCPQPESEILPSDSLSYQSNKHPQQATELLHLQAPPSREASTEHQNAYKSLSQISQQAASEVYPTHQCTHCIPARRAKGQPCLPLCL